MIVETKPQWPVINVKVNFDFNEAALFYNDYIKNIFFFKFNVSI